MPIQFFTVHQNTTFLTLNKPLKEAKKAYNLSTKIVNNIFYLTSIAVKDYEVTRLLYEKGGYVEDQIAYCKYYLKPSFEEKVAWEIAKINNLTKLIFLVSILKNLCCIAPFLKEENYSLNIKKDLDKSLTYLPEKLKQKILSIIEETEKLGFDTQKNIEFLSQIIVEKLLKPLLSSKD
ncbi:hypothetical protein DRO30_02945 [Candidatus Bathyarchaeota archaeon]|nr:MAG: hypothetical protein DRO30_02945 [Candidatus Bathyarchaeota archaeon]